MEHLEQQLEQAEQAYDKFFRHVSRAANYAEASETYRGKMFDVIEPELLDTDDVDERFEEEIEDAYRAKEEVEDELFILSGDIQAFLDGMTRMPEDVQQVDTQMGELRDSYRELKYELNIITGEKLPEEDVETWDIQHGHVKAEALKQQIGL